MPLGFRAQSACLCRGLAGPLAPQAVFPTLSRSVLNLFLSGGGFSTQHLWPQAPSSRLPKEFPCPACVIHSTFTTAPEIFAPSAQRCRTTQSPAAPTAQAWFSYYRLGVPYPRCLGPMDFRCIWILEYFHVYKISWVSSLNMKVIYVSSLCYTYILKVILFPEGNLKNFIFSLLT